MNLGKKISESFEVGTWLRQGDALSPTLFNVASEKVIRSLPVHQGMELLGNNMIYLPMWMIRCPSKEFISKTADLIEAAKTM